MKEEMARLSQKSLTPSLQQPTYVLLPPAPWHQKTRDSDTGEPAHMTHATCGFVTRTSKHMMA